MAPAQQNGSQNPHAPIQSFLNNALQGLQTITPPGQGANYWSKNGDDSDDDPFPNESDDEGPFTAPPRQAIHLIVKTPIIITGENNIMAIDPAAQAEKVTNAIICALETMAEGGNVPLTDAHGNLRAIKIDVSAEIKCRGNRNIVGEQAVLDNIIALTTRIVCGDRTGRVVPVASPAHPRAPHTNDVQENSALSSVVPVMTTQSNGHTTTGASLNDTHSNSGQANGVASQKRERAGSSGSEHEPDVKRTKTESED